MTLLFKEKWMTVIFYGIFLFFTGAAVFTTNWILAAFPFGLLFFYAGWQYRNLLFFLLLVSIPFSFEYNFSTSLGTDIPDEFLMLLVSLIFLAHWIYSPSMIPRKVISHPLLILLLLVLLWTIITVLFSTNRQLSIKFILAKAWYVGAFVLAPLVVCKNKRSLLIAAGCLLSSMALVTIIILFRHLETGFSFATINDAASPFFRNHVNYSAMLVCMLPLLVAFRAGTSNRNLKAALLVGMLLLLVTLFFSYARGAWLALLVGVISFWLIRKKMLLLGYLLAVLMVAGSFLWLKTSDRYLNYAPDYSTTIFHQDFGRHLVSTYQLKDISTAERFYRWVAGARMIKDNWLTGYGPNSFYENYKGYTIPAYKTWVSDNPEHSTVHNYFLLTGIEQGIPGLIFLLILLGAMLFYAQHIYHRSADMFYKSVAAVIGVMTTMIISVNFFSDLIETDKIGSLFFLCISVLIIADVKSRTEQWAIDNRQ